MGSPLESIMALVRWSIQSLSVWLAFGLPEVVSERLTAPARARRQGASRFSRDLRGTDALSPFSLCAIQSGNLAAELSKPCPTPRKEFHVRDVVGD